MRPVSMDGTAMSRLDRLETPYLPSARVMNIPVPLSDSLGRSLKKQWKRYRKEMKRLQKKFSEANVHEFRVAGRRLLANIELLEGFVSRGRLEKIRRLLKRQRDIFDQLRDTQVQLAAVSQMRPAFPEARAFAAHLSKREERLTRRARKDIKRIKAGRLREQLFSCRSEVEQRCKALTPQRANALVLRAVNRAFARTGRLQAGIDRRDTQTIHCTRVAFKRFRYMLEALAGCLPEARPKLLAAMHEYQTMMGDIQDAEMLLRALDKFLCGAELDGRAADCLRQEVLRRRDRRIRKYLGAAGQLFHFWPLDGAPRPSRNTKAKA